MKELLIAKKVSKQLLELLSPGPYKIHSKFNNGINLDLGGKLSFIGVGNKNIPPLGVLLNRGLDNGFIAIHDDFFYWDNNLSKLESNEISIDFTNVDIIDNRLKSIPNSIPFENIAMIMEIADKDTMTGFGKRVGDLFNSKEEFAKDFYESFNSRNSEDIQRVLKKCIGRGIGLTPSGDDFLQGLLYINEITPILGDVFIEELRGIINVGGYTTDISINFYKCAFCKMYSSTLIWLHQAIKLGNPKEIRRYIYELLELGNTSGADILSGILTGINFAYNMQSAENNSIFRI